MINKKHCEMLLPPAKTTNRDVSKQLEKNFAQREMAYDENERKRNVLRVKGFTISALTKGCSRKSYFANSATSEKGYCILREKNIAIQDFTYVNCGNTHFEVKVQFCFQRDACYTVEAKYQRTKPKEAAMNDKENENPITPRHGKSLRNIKWTGRRGKLIPTFRCTAVIFLRYFLALLRRFPRLFSVASGTSATAKSRKTSNCALLSGEEKEAKCITEEYCEVSFKRKNTIQRIPWRKKNVSFSPWYRAKNARCIAPSRCCVKREKSADVRVTLERQRNPSTRWRYGQNTRQRSIFLTMRAMRRIGVSIKNRTRKISNGNKKLRFPGVRDERKKSRLIDAPLDRCAVEILSMVFANVPAVAESKIEIAITRQPFAISSRGNGKRNAKEICRNFVDKGNSVRFIVSCRKICTRDKYGGKKDDATDIATHRDERARDVAVRDENDVGRDFQDLRNAVKRSPLREGYDERRNIAANAKYDETCKPSRRENIAAESKRRVNSTAGNVCKNVNVETWRFGSSVFYKRTFGDTVSRIFKIVQTRLILSCLVVCAVKAKRNCPNMEVLDNNGITCDVIKEIVDTHNALRQSVAEGSVGNQPPATDMREVYWDEELAKGAQDWANHCIFAHNDAKDREVARFQVGQNIALTKTKRTRGNSNMEFRRHIYNWFNEHSMYRFGLIKTMEDVRTTGHYTQLVWASTYLVGCGYSRYKSASNVTHRLYVCHYGPSGNEIGATPYTNGTLLNCAHFLKLSKEYKNLCGLKKPPPNRCKSNDFTRRTLSKNILEKSGRRFLSHNDNNDQTAVSDDEQFLPHSTTNRPKNNDNNQPPVYVNVIYNIIFFML